MATRRLVTRSKGRLTGIRSALRVAALRLFPAPLAPAPVVVSPRRRGRSR